MKILVFRDNCEAIGTRVFPDRTVVCFVQIDVSDMLRIGKQIRKASDEFVGEIMVKEIASWVNGRYQFALAVGSKSEAGTNVFLRQVWKVVKDFLL